MKRRIKINGLIIFTIVVLIAFFPDYFFRKGSRGFLDGISKMLGLAFILLGQIFRVSARGYKSEYSQQGKSLIQGGPYELVRNPMYLGILLIGLGVVMMLFHWWMTGIFFIVFLLRYLRLIFREEEKLKGLFPKEYPDYQRSVPRIIPSLKAILAKDISAYLPLKLSWFKKEIGSILAVLLIVLLAEFWQVIRTQGIQVYLGEIPGLFLIIVLFLGLIKKCTK